MSEDRPKPRLITPPPGLLPEPPAREAEGIEGTDSGTRRLPREAPVFFARPPGAPAPVTPDPAELHDTVIAPRDPAPDPTASPARWALRTPDGVEHPVPETGIVVGRNPALPAGWEAATLLAVLDPGRSVSKTHAALRADDGELTVLDLSSTNGTTVVAPDGTGSPVGTDAPTPVQPGAAIALGSLRLEVLSVAPA